MLSGIDFSSGGGLTTGQIKGGGKQFVCRYLSGGNPKDINAAELANYMAAGIPVVFVWETDGIMRSEAEGAADARSADAQLKTVGAPGAVVFFAADADVMPDLHGYMTGAVSVLGKARTGIYGGYANVKAALDQGLAAYGWQTLAWSAGQWDIRALIRQVQNNVKFGPATVDLDEAAYWNSSRILTTADDFGQHPRPPAPQQGLHWHVFDGRTSLGEVTRGRGFPSTLAWLDTQRKLQGINAERMASEAVPPKGAQWVSVNP